MTDPKQFDVFISYRNSYYETRPDGTKRKIDVGFGVARDAAYLLNEKKYRVYFDNFTLSGGDDWERHIFTSIPACRDVILVLVPQALDRCADENDIFGKEIVAALEGGKNIIPVFVNGFSFPETIDELPEMLRGPARTFQEKTKRSFVRLQGAKVQASETISAENSRMIKNTIVAEVIPNLKSVPGINKLPKPEGISKGSVPPFGPGKKKMQIKLALAAAVVLAGAAAYLKMELLSPEETAAGTLPPPPQATAEIPDAGTDVPEAEVPPATAPQDAATSGDESDSADVAAGAAVNEPEKPSADGVPASGDEAKSAAVPAGDSAETKESVPAPEPPPVSEPAPASVEELVAAVKDGDAERVNAILDSGTDVNAVAENGATALCSAVLRGNFEIVSALLDSGANPNFVMSENGMTPLHIAAARNDVVTTKLLIAAGADVSVRTKDGLLPVDFAEDEEIKKLLENLAK